MKIMLFDMWAGGHTARYFDRFRAALAGHDLVAVVPASVAADLPADLAVSTVAHPRSAPVYGRPEESWDESIQREIELIEEIVRRERPDLFVHLFADHLVARASEIARLVPTALLVLFPSRHYPSDLGYELTEREVATADAVERAVDGFRRSPGAAAVLTLDSVAAARWSHTVGAPAVWLPEPWIDAAPAADITRGGDIVFFGAIAHRKGFHLLVDALLCRPPAERLVVAGWIEQDGYDRELADQVTRLRDQGWTVDLRLRRHDEQACLDLMAAARVAVLPYRRHFGMSRVFLEAMRCRTPVVVNDFGLLAHLVAADRLGAVADVTDPWALSAAIDEAAALPADPGFASRCDRFGDNYSRRRFTGALDQVLGAVPTAQAASSRREGVR